MRAWGMMMAYSKKIKAGALVIATGFVISSFFVNCAQVVFSQDFSSFSQNAYSSNFEVDEDSVLRDIVDVDKILGDLNATSAKTDVKVIADPKNGKLNSFDTTTGRFEYTPNPNFFGDDSFRYQITVNDGKSEAPIVISQTAFVRVRPINDAPVVEEKEVGVTSANGAADILISAQDVDDQVLEYTISALSQGGTVEALGGNKFSYFPKCGFSGVEQLSVRVSDPQGAVGTGVVTVRVTPDSGSLTLARTLAQDSVLNDSLQVLLGRCMPLGGGNTMSVTANPTKGAISNVVSSNLSYTYKPNAGFYGADTTTFAVRNGSYQKNVVVNFTVTHVNKLPTLNKTAYEVYQNNFLVFNLEINDPDDAVVQSFLTASRENRITTSLGATLEAMAGTNEYRYTPPRGVKGITDSAIFYLFDKTQQAVPVTVTFSILANPIVDLKPGLAARGLSCTVCHAQINANVITDFGHGSSFAHSGLGWAKEPYSDSVVSVFDKSKPLDPLAGVASILEDIRTWESGKIMQTLHVPNAVGGESFNFQPYPTYLRTLRPKFYELVTFAFSESGDLLSGALGGSYVRTPGTMGAVQGYNDIYIGAPTAADIKNRMTNQSATHDIQGSLQGMGWRSGVSKTYFTNTASTVNCEGDVIVQGTVLVNMANIKTTKGCRIYATGPIFVQGNLNISSPTVDNSGSNLQLSSSVAIMMGIGTEAIDIRRTYALPTRGDLGGIGIMNTVSVEASNLGAVLQDAMRHNSRRVQFSRLLLNAPQVHSRYNDVFRGTIIAEIAVMSPGEFVYYFDDVFLNPNIEILPLLAGPKILKVR